MQPERGIAVWALSVLEETVQGYLAHKKIINPLGLPQDPRHRLTVGSYGKEFSYSEVALYSPL